jgi:hypothetical protein
MRIKDLSQKEIEDGLKVGIKSAKEILNDLKTDESINLSELYDLILADLKNMGYQIIYDDVLNDLFKRQGMVSATYGKTVKINKKSSFEAQFESVIHEYVHIKNNTLPKPTLDEFIENIDKYLDTDNKIDMIANTLMMPQDKMKNDLWNNKYDIHKILDIYKDLEKSTVLQWSVLKSLFPCHFAWIMLIMKNKKEIYKIFYDNCDYNLSGNPGKFDIKRILNHEDSAIAQAIKTQSDVNKMTKIGVDQYYCYAYYEKDLQKDIYDIDIKDIDTKKFKSIHYDRVLVIGWKEYAYKNTVEVMNYAKELYSKDSAKQ